MNILKKECDNIAKIIENSSTIPIFDGVINPEQYIKSSTKILWILKESNSKDKKSWSFIDCFSNPNWLLKNNKLPSIRRVVYISHGILTPNLNSWKDMPSSTDLICQESVKKIAYINIKKEPGGSNSNDKIIFESAKSNHNLLKKQISVYTPDIIILGNTLKYFAENRNDIFGENIGEYKVSPFNNHYYETKNRLYINAYHPSFIKGFTDENYVMDIVNICKKWINMKNNTKGNNV